MSLPLTDALRQQYTDLFKTCQPAALASLSCINSAVDHIVANQSRYQSVATPLSIPWYFVGIVHHMEASLNFNCHLHNGDPLSARTVHVPAGRPPTGNPPFTWEQSATDALKNRAVDRATDWTIPGFLYQLEAYNGFGYRLSHPEVLSPYLWAMSNKYTKGKYTADGVFDPNAVSNQEGGALVLRRMAERNIVQFAPPADPSHAAATPPSIAALGCSVTYSTSVCSPAAKTLQLALNQFPGVFLLANGIPGPETSDAFKAVTGESLQGDPRATQAAASIR